MRSMLVIGLGRFGKNLAKTLVELGNEVMAVDNDEENVNEIAQYVTRAQVGDCKDEDVLRALGVGNFDICFVCISQYFQSSLEITSLLKELGAKHVISKADRDIHAKFLMKIGADEIVHPERDTARRVAAKCSMPNAFDYIELTPEYSITEVQAPKEWVGKAVKELAIRSRYNINIIGTKLGNQVEPMISPDYTFKGGEHLLVAGSKKDTIKLLDKA